MEQISLWELMYEKKKITKPIRLIEFFAGIGAQHKALEQLGIPCESHKIAEWAYNSIVAYNAIHQRDFTDYSKDKSIDEMVERIKGISVNYNEPLTEKQIRQKGEKWIRSAYNNCEATHNLINIMDVKGEDLDFTKEDAEKYEFIATYSFPCQDLSLAGKGKGMHTSQKDGGTRSGLLWEFERILLERESSNLPLPQILLMENVPQVIGQNAIKDFQKWEMQLERLGYSNYVEILNSKDYGIPQNRNRCFMVSILGQYDYKFPKPFKRKYNLKDFLDKNVEERFYLSDKMLEYVTKNGEKTPSEENDVKTVGNYSQSGEFGQRAVLSSEGISNTMTTGNHGEPTAIKESDDG